MTGRTPAQNAELAMLVEVAGTPKPGNVDRHRDHEDLRFEHFLAGAVGSAPAFREIPAAPLGEAFERAVEGMSHQRGGNTQFGCLLLLVPLLYARAGGAFTPESVREVVADTTVEDACSFYRAFEHVDVAVGDPPEGLEPLDVRRGSDAVPAIRDRGLTLSDVMARSAPVDDVSREWTTGFERTFRAAEWILDDEGPLPDRGARAFLRLLAARPDTFVVKTQGEAAARAVMDRAQACLDGDADPEAVAEEFVERGFNPGTTADLTCSGLFVALERGAEV